MLWQDASALRNHALCELAESLERDHIIDEHEASALKDLCVDNDPRVLAALDVRTVCAPQLGICPFPSLMVVFALHAGLAGCTGLRCGQVFAADRDVAELRETLVQIAKLCSSSAFRHKFTAVAPSLPPSTLSASDFGVPDVSASEVKELVHRAAKALRLPPDAERSLVASNDPFVIAAVQVRR